MIPPRSKEAIATLAAAIITVKARADAQSVAQAIEDARHLLYPGASPAFFEWRKRTNLVEDQPMEDADEV